MSDDVEQLAKDFAWRDERIKALEGELDKSSEYASSLLERIRELEILLHRHSNDTRVAYQELAAFTRVRQERDDLKSEVERLKVELVATRHDLTESNRQRDEAQAAAAVMREALDGCAKHFVEMEDVVWNDDSDVTSETFLEAQKSVQAALSTTAGTSFLARMAEAEWIITNRCVGTHQTKEWFDRKDAFLKGGGVKA